MNHDPIEPHIQLSEDAPHRLRRADDREELRIRQAAWEQFRAAGPLYLDGPILELQDAFNAALDLYRQELAALAIKRMGVRLP